MRKAFAPSFLLSRAPGHPCGSALSRQRVVGLRLLLRVFGLLCLLLLASSAHASRTVIDELGRRVTLPDHPHRILCLAPGVVDTVYELGAGDDVIAVTDFVRYPAEALRKPTVGLPMQPSLETVAALHPDLAIGMQTGLPLDANAQVERLGVPVFLIAPHGLDGVLHSVVTIGDALNRRPQAEALVQRLHGRIAAVRLRTQSLPRPSVFMPVWYDPIVTIGRHAFITEIIDAAGGRSVTADLPTEWPNISLEAVVARAPQALLLVRGGKVGFDNLKDRPGWKTLPAIQQHRVFYADNRIDLASPLAIDALEDLARQFHP